MDKDGKTPLGKFKFNHNKNSFLEALGVTEEQADGRVKFLKKTLVTCQKKQVTKSEVVEALSSDDFSKEDLAFYLSEMMVGNMKVEGSFGLSKSGISGTLEPEQLEKLKETLKDIGIDVSGFPEENIEDAKAESLKDLLKKLM